MYLIKLIYLLSYLTLSASNFGNKEPKQEEKEEKEEAKLVQRNISLFNGSRLFHRSPYGDLVPIQGVAFHDSNANPEKVGAMIISSDGREIFAVTDNAQFVSLQLSSEELETVEIEKLSRHEMLDIGGKPLREECKPEGLSSEGVYEGGGIKGDFYVGCATLSYGIKHLTLKFKGNTATEEVAFITAGSTRISYGMTGLLRLRSENDSYLNDMLLRTSNMRYLDEPRLVYVHPTSVSNIHDPVGSFGVVVRSGSEIVAMSQLSNGDVMILMKKSDADGSNKEISIGYLTAAQLANCMRKPTYVRPQVVMEVKESEGYDLPNVTGLAIHEYPNSDYYLLYIIGNRYNHDLGRVEMQLSKYLRGPQGFFDSGRWVPKGSTNSFPALLV